MKKQRQQSVRTAEPVAPIPPEASAPKLITAPISVHTALHWSLLQKRVAIQQTTLQEMVQAANEFAELCVRNAGHDPNQCGGVEVKTEGNQAILVIHPKE